MHQCRAVDLESTPVNALRPETITPKPEPRNPTPQFVPRSLEVAQSQHEELQDHLHYENAEEDDLVEGRRF